MLTKKDSEGILKECKGFDVDSLGTTYAVQTQRNVRYLSCWKCTLSYGIRAYGYDGVEGLTWNHCRTNEQIGSDTELHDANCVQDACDPFVLPSYSVSPVMIKVSERIQSTK